MLQPAAEVCANCEEPILGGAVYFDGLAYCCSGCVAGGPCICTYDYSTYDSAPVVEPPAPDYTPYAPPQSEPAANEVFAGDRTAEEEPLVRPARRVRRQFRPARRLRRPTPPRALRLVAESADADDAAASAIRPVMVRPLILRAAGFADQLSLLRFAHELEQQRWIGDIELVRGGDLDDVWMAVRVPNTEELEAAVRDIGGFEVLESRVVPGGVEVRVRETAMAATGEPEPRALRLL
jgi:hypothetical protein